MNSVDWQPRQKLWDAQALIASVQRPAVSLDAKTCESLREYFWFDLCAEWDSLYLHQEIHKKGDFWSDEFLRFEAAWYEDELNHAEGFLELYSLLYGEDRDSIRDRLKLRRPDFGPVNQFLTSEFSVCLLFAYDELATMRAYRLDLDLYTSLGAQQFSQWIRLLLRDESFHHRNGFDLVVRNHSHRFDEIDSVIDEFLAFDSSNPSYKATFIFDHEWGHVEPNFFVRTAAILKHCFARHKNRAS